VEEPDRKYTALKAQGVHCKLVSYIA